MMWKPYLILLVSCMQSHDVETAAVYTPSAVDYPKRLEIETISSQDSATNSMIRRKMSFKARSKTQFPSDVFYDTNVVLPAGTRHESSPYFQDISLSSEDEKNECSANYDCQKYMVQSVCQTTATGSECRCLPNYFPHRRECLKMVNVGERCKIAKQCPLFSFCAANVCVCKSGYVRRGDVCRENSSYLETPNFLMALIAGVVCLIVVSCLFVVMMSIRRKLRNAIRRIPADGPPTVSSQVDAREPFSPDPAYERIDKPPSYDEAMSSSTSVLTLNTEDLAAAPPSYSQVQSQNRSVNNAG